MISIQVPQYMNHHMSAYNPMSHASYINGMGAISKPIQQLAKSSNPGAKRRPSRAGTRSVATLTSAQLERKRANDREAQRAIRQRTKDHIDSLEKRIQELTSNDDAAARLSQALQRNEELEQENKVLRSRLNQAATAMAEGSPISADMLTGPDSPTKKLRVQTRASSVPTAPRSIPTSIMTPSSLATHQEQSWSVPYGSPISSTADERSPSLTDSPVSGSMRWGASPAHQQPSPVLSDPGLAAAAAAAAHQQGFSYMIDNHGRAVSYSPSAEAQQHMQMQQHHHQFSSPASSAAEGNGLMSFAPQHHHQQTPGGPMPLPSPAYSQYQPTTPQSFLGAAGHEAVEASAKFQQMLGQHSPVEPSSLMYNMGASIKE